MNDKEKELAVQIFDHFFKKAGISSIKIFYCHKDSFILDICDAKSNWHTVYDKDSHNFMQFSVPKGQCSVVHFSVPKDQYDSVSSYHAMVMKLGDVPKEIKEAIVNGCINRNALSVIFSWQFKTLLPGARSLEELAIKMELEK